MPAAIELVPGGLLIGGARAQFTKGGPPSYSAMSSLFGERGDGGVHTGAFAGESSIADLALQPSGNVLAVGAAPPELGVHPWQALLSKLNSGTYSLDSSFAGDDGVARLEYGDGFSTTVAHAVATSGNRILVSGTTGRTLSSTDGYRLFVAQFDANGELDRDFGDNGTTIAFPPGAAPASVASASDIAVLPDGRAIVAGISRGDVVVTRLNPDGSIDGSFGEAGWARFPRPGTGSGSIQIAPAAAGKLLVSDVSDSIRVPFVVAQFTSDGRLDPTFGENGVAAATPCRGSIAKRRRRGCIASALVHLRPRHISRRRPGLSIRVRHNQPLDPIEEVRLILPPSLRVDPRRRGLVQVQNPQGSRRPRVKLRADEIMLNRLGNPRAVRLELKKGLLKRASRRRRGGALVFRIRVDFADVSAETFRFRR